MDWLFVFIIGLCIGSFLNVIIYRLPRGMSVNYGRSFCPQCKKKIDWLDNIPLLSFFLLKGKCRYCQKSISWRYPLVELITAVLTLVTFYRFASSAYGLIFTIYYLLLVWSSIPIFFIDLELQIIPDEILVFDFVISILFLISQSPQILMSNLLVAFFSAGFFIFLHLLTKGKGMGLGDVKFAFLLGFILGFPKAIICFYLAFLTGAAIGSILIIIKKIKLGKQIAFGPFLSSAFLISIFEGENLIWWLGKFFP